MTSNLTTALALAICFAPAACGGEGEPDELVYQQSAEGLRPSLASICSLRCFNSHGQTSCADNRSSGQANVGFYPLLEGKTKVATALLGTAGWNTSSCPNCQWSLNSVTTTYLSGGTAPTTATAVNGASVAKNMNSSIEYEWQGDVSITIWDPTDASVGTCTLNATGYLSNF